jgi:hypothetical protein
MKKILFSSLLLLSISSFSQNYQNICSPGNTIFVSADSKYSAFRFDSVRSFTGDSIYYSYAAFRDTTSNYYFPSCIDTAKGSVFGRKVIRLQDGTFEFFNRFNDTIILKTTSSINLPWKIFSLKNNDYLEAKVTSIAPDNVVGINDSVKTILLQAKDSSGNPVEHPMNGRVIRLSKSYGLVSFYDTYYFPVDTVPFLLAGKTFPQLGYQEPSSGEIYDWPAGAVFHYKDDGGYEKDDLLQTGRPPHYSFHGYSIKKILDKTITADSVIYSFQICSLLTSGYSGYEDTTREFVINRESYPLRSGIEYLDRLPDEYNSMGHLYRLAVSGVNNAPAKIIEDYYYQRYDCWLSSYNQPSNSDRKTYARNLGMTGEHQFVFYGGPNLVSDHQLVYFSCDTLTWGTPLYSNCDALLSNEAEAISEAGIITILPNPVHQVAKVEINGIHVSGDLSFCLYNNLGQKLICRQVETSTFSLDRKDFSSGLYFYFLADGKGRKISSGTIIFK